MSLVSGDDRSRRVGPQVFADVPSQGKLDAIRSNRNTFATMLVLALGALALAVAGLLYFANQASEVPQLRIDHAKALDLKDEQIADLTTQLQGYEGISEIVELRARAAADRAAIEAHEAALRDRAMAGLRELNWVKLHGAAADKGAIVAFSVEGAHPHDVAQILDRQGVAVRAGHHCAQPLMQRLGVTATARASFAAYNRLEEVDVFIEALHKARKLLG